MATDMASLKTTFGERMKIRRLELKMNQADLAKILKMHQPDISTLEKGEHAPNLDTVERVAKALKTTHTYLLGE